MRIRLFVIRIRLFVSVVKLKVVLTEHRRGLYRKIYLEFARNL